MNPFSHRRDERLGGWGPRTALRPRGRLKSNCTMTKLHSFGASIRLSRPTEPPASACSLVDSIEQTGAAMSFPRDAKIYNENSSADYLYKVISGTVRTYKSLSNGRRQIRAFYMPGDIFGVETTEVHAFSAEAVTDAELLVINRSAVVALAARNHSITRQLWSLTSRELEHARGHVLLLTQSAQERVAGFLLEMADRAPVGNEVELPMSRQDIADYLGLTIETVSRTLTHLEKGATIALPTSRRVVLRSRSALNRLNAESAWRLRGNDRRSLKNFDSPPAAAN
jgi:CRP/FNR family transcriptional regulator, nitrogen fixation regulation protein